MEPVKTVETLRGLGGALGCSWPSDPRSVTPPPAGTDRHFRNIYTPFLKKKGEDLLVPKYYLDVRAVRYVGSAGVHCRCETLGRWGRGLCSRTEGFVEHLKKKKQHTEMSNAITDTEGNFING